MDLKAEIAERMDISTKRVDEIIEHFCSIFAEFFEEDALAYLAQISDIHLPDSNREGG